MAGEAKTWRAKLVAGGCCIPRSGGVGHEAGHSLWFAHGENQRVGRGRDRGRLVRGVVHVFGPGGKGPGRYGSRQAEGCRHCGVMPENNSPFSLGLARLLNAVLSTDPKQRGRVSRSLMAAFVYVVGGLLCEFGLRRWPLSVAGVRVYELLGLLVCAGTYVALRSGWSLRFGDPSLTMLQIAAAQLSGALFYAVMSPVRGAMLSLQVMIALFAIFSLKLREQLQVTGQALLVMGLTMVTLAWWWPQTYEPAVEWVHFTVLLTILTPVSLLGVQLTSMRLNLAQQKADLETALDRIKTLVDKDEMTGLLNRRAMREMILHHLKLQSRSGDGSVLALINLDAFRRINDLYGHAVGDDALRLFAQEVRKVLRDRKSVV